MKRKKKENRMEMTSWEEEKDEVDRYEQERSSSEGEVTEKELKRMKLGLEVSIVPKEGELRQQNNEWIQQRVASEMEEFQTGDKPSFMLDMIEYMAQRILNPEVEEKYKMMEITSCANAARNVVRLLENNINIEKDRSKLYREDFYKMKEKYISFRRKYEASTGEEIKKKEIQVETVRRETKEIGTQVERIRKEKGIQVETGIEGKTSGRED